LLGKGRPTIRSSLAKLSLRLIPSESFPPMTANKIDEVPK